MFDSANKDMVRPDNLGQIRKGFLRPPFIQPMFCKNVLIEGITIINSPFWTVNPEFCENVTIHKV
jgi:polygalacturonase